jgi:hypothetical protein
MHFLKQNKLDDEKIVYPISGAINSQWSPSKTSMTLLQDQVYFCTLTLIFRDIELKHIVSMLNSVTSGLLDVNADKVKKSLSDWMVSFGLKKTAAIKAVVFSGKELKDGDICSILAAEEPWNMVDFTSSYINDRSMNNIAQYSSAKIFASDAVILEIPKEFKGSFENRLFGELATIFVVELHVQRIAFLGYFEEQLDKISVEMNGKSINTLTALNSQVIDAMGLWQTNIYRRILARSLSDEIGKAFKVEQNFKQLTDGKAMLEQLVGILKLNSDEKENKEQNRLLLILATMQVFPFLNSITATVGKNEVKAADLWIGGVSFVLTIFLYFIFKIINK